MLVHHINGRKTRRLSFIIFIILIVIPISSDIVPHSEELLSMMYQTSELVTNPICFSSYLGGSSPDRAYSLDLDRFGNIYVAGSTESLNLQTVNAYDSTYNGGFFDCFVMKIFQNGSLAFLTYIGGSGNEWGNDIAVDSSCNVYVSGFTDSGDFPRKNAFDSTINGDYDCFILKLNATGNGLIYSTFIGGSDQDRGYAIDIDKSDNVFVSGFTQSADFPIVNAYDNSTNGSADIFVLKLNSTGTGLLYSTFVGGSEWDELESIAVDATGSVCVTG